MTDQLLSKRIHSNASMDSIKQMGIGTLTIIAVYLGNFFLIQNNSLNQLDIKTVGLLLATLVILGVLFLRQRNYRNEELETELREYFNVSSDDEVADLSQRVSTEMKNQRLFVMNKYRITGTKNFLVIDTEKKNFHILPAKEIKRLEIRKVGRGAGLLVDVGKGDGVVVVFKSENEARKLSTKIRENYMKK